VCRHSTRSTPVIDRVSKLIEDLDRPCGEDLSVRAVKLPLKLLVRGQHRFKLNVRELTSYAVYRGLGLSIQARWALWPSPAEKDGLAQTALKFRVWSFKGEELLACAHTIILQA
jgi:hypothetical protein